MQINAIFDPSTAIAPSGYFTAVNYAVGVLDAAFSNNVTLNIQFGWGEVDSFPIHSGDDGNSLFTVAPAYSYGTIRDALVAGATSPIQQAAYATFSATDPTGGGNFDIGTAEAKALGLIAPNAPGVDGEVGFDSTEAWSFDPTQSPGPGEVGLVAVIEHEITEVMGRNSFLGTSTDYPREYPDSFGTPDLFRYSSPGVRQLAPGPAGSTGYFSIDGGLTNRGVWNNHVALGDLGDWSTNPRYDGPGPNGQDAFDNASSNVAQPLTDSDLTLMDVLGWNPAAPANFVINGETYFVLPGEVADNLVVLAGGALVVGPGGTSNGATLGGGDGEVFQNGVANAAVVNTGHQLTIDAGGTANDTSVAGGKLEIRFGGTADATVLITGTLEVDGTANGSVLEGGKMFVDFDAAANNSIVAGGTMVVEFGGAINGATIAGGLLDIHDGGSSGTAPIAFEGPGGILDIDAATAPANVISGFSAGDSIDFFGAQIGASPTVQLLAGNVLTINEHNKTYQFQFDPNDDFSGQTFHVAGDGHGGTLIFIDPTVLSVMASGSGIVAGMGDLDADQVVMLTLNTNEPVNVDTSGGSPTLTLNDGGTATFSGGSGSNALDFQYKVAAGQNTPDLGVTAFNLNGATAIDANGHTAVFAGAIGNPAGTLQIDTIAPTLRDISAFPSAGIHDSGSSIAFTVAFDEPVKVAGGTPTLSLGNLETAIYDAATTAAQGDPTKLAFNYLVSATDFPTASLTITGLDAHGAVVTDLAGNPANLTNASASFGGLSVNADLPPFLAQPSQSSETLHSPSVPLACSSDFHLI